MPEIFNATLFAAYFHRELTVIQSLHDILILADLGRQFNFRAKILKCKLFSEYGYKVRLWDFQRTQGSYKVKNIVFRVARIPELKLFHRSEFHGPEKRAFD